MAATKTRRPKGAGSTRQLPSGRWQARFTGPDDVMRSAPETYDTKVDAGAWLAAQARDVAASRWEAPTEKRAAETVRQYAETWLAGRDLKPRTRYQYRRLLDDLVLPHLGSLPVGRLTPTTVRAWHGQLREDAAARHAAAVATAKKAKKTPPRSTGETWVAQGYSLLRAICTTAVSDELLEANPCRVRGAGRTKTRHQPKPATLAELETMVAAVPERYQLMLLLAAWCALRFGELTELRRGDVDVAAKKVHIDRGVVLVDGVRIVGDPKSDAGKRTVSIPPHLVPLLEAHLEAHVYTDPGALLFPARKGYLEPPAEGQHMSASALYKPYYAARAVAGRDDLKFHDLRHTGATLAAATGATIGDLMQRLGHSTAAAALRYQHAVDDDRDAAIALALSGFADAGKVALKGKK